MEADLAATHHDGNGIPLCVTAGEAAAGLPPKWHAQAQVAKEYLSSRFMAGLGEAFWIQAERHALERCNPTSVVL